MRTTRAPIAPLLLIAGLAACDRDAVDSSRSAVTEAAAPVMKAAVPAEGSAAPVATLPLRLGYYVASDTPCSEASNATVSLLRRGGIGGSRDFCEFRKIDRITPSTYRVTQACKDFQDGGPPQDSVVTYTLSGDARFTSRNRHGWEYSARHCAQSSMPASWRQNDIREPSG